MNLKSEGIYSKVCHQRVREPNNILWISWILLIKTYSKSNRKNKLKKGLYKDLSVKGLLIAAVCMDLNENRAKGIKVTPYYKC